MLLAANESAVTKKPRLRLMMRRSSSVRPLGLFHSAMSRVMFTSCGIQWLAQVARYFSQAHLYLKGTSWLTSVLALMMRLSAAFTRLWVLVDAPLSALLAEGARVSSSKLSMVDSLERAAGCVHCRPAFSIHRCRKCGGRRHMGALHSAAAGGLARFGIWRQGGGGARA